MNWTILLPHYKTGKMSAYCVHQLLKHKGRHEIEIIVIDNSQGEGMEYLEPYFDRIKVLKYPPGIMQSHGLAFDYALPYVETEYFITVESDSFPTQDNWLDYYEDLVNKGFDCAGSLLHLSGGQYIHPAGAMYKAWDWQLAKTTVANINKFCYYYPNLGMKDGFPCHIMAAGSEGPLIDFPDKHHSYNNVSFEDQRKSYIPIAESVFHNGMGTTQESYFTYGQRNMQTGVHDIAGEGIQYPVYRMGYEPGQWFCYWLASQNKSIFPIPTITVWLPDRVNQQQEYTLMANGFKHLWGVTAYHGVTAEDREDIVSFKQNQMNELWETINTSQHQK